MNGDRTPTRAPRDQRVVYVDWLRVLALAGVFVIHVCEVFNPAGEWHITNAERTPFAAAITVVMAPWIMPLLMVLAGTGAWYSLQHRSNGAYLRERVSRLLLPLVAGTLMLVPPQVYLERRIRGQFTGSFLSFFPHFFQGIYPRGNLSWHHLWFLAHLLLYSVLALPLFRFWQGDRGRSQLTRLARLCGGRAGLLWLALPLVLERQFLWGLFPERHMLTSDWSNHALLLVAYLYGFILAGEPWLGAAIDAQWRDAFAVAAAITTLLIAGTWTGVIPERVPPPYTPSYLTFWTLYAVDAWACIVVVLGLARRWLVVETRVLRIGRAQGLGWYLLHQPVIVAVAYVVVQKQAGVASKFVAIFVISLLATLAGTALLQRIPVFRSAFGLAAPATTKGIP